MYLSITNNSVTYHHDKTIINVNVTDEVLTKLHTLSHTHRLKSTSPKHEEIMAIIGGKDWRYTENTLFFKKGESMYLRDVPQISIPNKLLEVMYPIPTDNLLNFWKLSALNPDPVGRDGLFWFLDKYDYEITEEGYFLAYRNVQTTEVDGVYTDKHTGTFVIRIGEPVSIDRRLCDNNPQSTCSTGLHVASKEWLKSQGGSFGNKGIICLVNPMHVVAVPKSDGYGKMRVSQYLPIAYIDGKKDIAVKTFSPTYDKITMVELNTLLATVAIRDGEIKKTCSSLQDYRKLVNIANAAIKCRITNK